MLDYRIRDVENFFRRTVVSFEFIYFRVFEISFKTENVIYIRAAPAVDTLIVVADGENIAVRVREHFYDIVLNGVGILKLVDMNISESV
ncbi:putative uncharacterized protein [Acidiphilium sp. CAG:727]|nr:putative uncharacterized protein [Acidiphilium sp. CAG:727]